MSSDSLMNTPVLWINKYLGSKLSDLGFATVPFFPSLPTNLEDLTSAFPDNTTGLMSTYDRMFRMNRKQFPHIKSEQLLYYFYATQENSTENLTKLTEAVHRLLDRGDESAQEVNDWCSNRVINIGSANSPDPIDNIFFFHNFKVYQLEETRDIIDFGTARTYGGNKIIIDFEYHQNPVGSRNGNEDKVTYSDWKPEPKPQNKIMI